MEAATHMPTDDELVTFWDKGHSRDEILARYPRDKRRLDELWCRRAPAEQAPYVNTFLSATAAAAWHTKYDHTLLSGYMRGTKRQQVRDLIMGVYGEPCSGADIKKRFPHLAPRVQDSWKAWAKEERAPYEDRYLGRSQSQGSEQAGSSMTASTSIAETAGYDPSSQVGAHSTTASRRGIVSSAAPGTIPTDVSDSASGSTADTFLPPFLQVVDPENAKFWSPEEHDRIFGSDGD